MESARSAESLIEGLDRAHIRACESHLEFLRFVFEIDRLELWRDCDAVDMAQWLYIRYGVSHWKASRWIAAARALVDLPAVSEALRSGRLGIDKVVELTRFATPETERGLVAWAEGVAPARIRHRGDLERRDEPSEVVDVHSVRYLDTWHFDDGRQLGFQGAMPSAEGAVFVKGLRRRMESLPVMPGEEHSHFTTQRMADALVAMASEDLAAHPDPDRATIVVHANVDSSGALLGGVEIEGTLAVVPEVTAERLLCTARVQALVENASGDVVGVGRMVREPSEWMIRQLRHRDRGCTFPGCGASRWTQAHHIEWWSRGGRTELENLILTCLFHHHLVHEYGWSVCREPDGEIVWRRPDGVRFRTGPAPPWAA